MHHQSRRRFVAASLAGLPILAGGTASLFGSSFTLNAAQPRGLVSKPEAAVQSPSFSDPVLDSITSDFRDLAREWEEKPHQRRSVLRASEALTGVLAAHFGKNYDANLRRGLRRQLQRKGRQAFVQEMTAKINKSDITHETMDAAITLLEQRGVEGALRDAQKALRKLRDNVAEFQQVKHMQFDYCSDLRWVIEHLTNLSTLACGIAILEPTPGGEIACGAMMVALGLYQIQYSWWC